MPLLPKAIALSFETTTRAEAPSLMPDALAAVTVPSFMKADFNLATLSRVTPFLMYSSSATITVTAVSESDPTQKATATVTLPGR